MSCDAEDDETVTDDGAEGHDGDQEVLGTNERENQGSRNLGGRPPFLRLLALSSNYLLRVG